MPTQNRHRKQWFCHCQEDIMNIRQTSVKEESKRDQLFRSSKGAVRSVVHRPLVSLALLIVWLVLSMALLPAVSAHAATSAITTISTTIPPDLTSVEVSFPGSGGITLHGTILELTQARTGKPGVVLVTGAGPGPRTERLPEAIAFARQ